MTVHDIANVIQRIKYKRAKFDWNINFRDECVNLHITLPVLDVYTGESTTVTMSNVIASCDVRSEEALLRLIRANILTLEVHEIDEWFALDGIQVNNPHPGQQAAVRQVSTYKIWEKEPKLSIPAPTFYKDTDKYK